MSKWLRYVLACGVAMVAILWGAAPPALALKAFKDQFESKYVREKPATEKEKAFAEAVAKAKCNVCHEGKKKTDRNVYGQELAKLLDKKADKDNVEKIQKALDKVAAMQSDQKDKKSPKFGELIAAGKLPGGEPKKEEEKKEEEE